MNPQIFVATAITALHDLFTAIWIGGMIVLAWAVLPALRKTMPDTKERRPVALAIQKRLRIIVIISMVGLWITGMLLSKHSPMAHGLFKFGTPYTNVLSIKHILMFAMVACAAARTIVMKKLVETPSKKLEKASAIILFVNLAFGVVVVFLSALLATFSWALA